MKGGIRNVGILALTDVSKAKEQMRALLEKEGKEQVEKILGGKGINP